MRKNHILMLAIFFLLVFTLPGLAAEKEPLWQFEAGMPLTGTPTYDKGVVYIGDQGGAVYALNAETGELIWQYDAGTSINGAAAMNEKTIFVGEQMDVSLPLKDLQAICSGKLFSAWTWLRRYMGLSHIWSRTSFCWQRRRQNLCF